MRGYCANSVRCTFFSTMIQVHKPVAAVGGAPLMVRIFEHTSGAASTTLRRIILRAHTTQQRRMMREPGEALRFSQSKLHYQVGCFVRKCKRHTTAVVVVAFS